MNRYPLWKYLLMLGLLLIGVIYALPNLYGEDPAIEISAKNTTVLTPELSTKIREALNAHGLNYLTLSEGHDNILVRFADSDIQLKAQDFIKATIGNDYVVALNLAPRTPAWLQALGAQPMKLGLDLRGGVHFLLDVDTKALIQGRQEGDLRGMSDALREANIRYANIASHSANIIISLRDATDNEKAKRVLAEHFTDFQFTAVNNNLLQAQLTPAALEKIDDYAVNQAMTILRNRVNELGVSEALVQRQGTRQVSVDLPGIQDTARAKDLIGKTATIRFQLVDSDHDLGSALAGNIPFGSKLYDYEGQPILLKNQAILSGSAITFATAGYGQNGRPNVQVQLGGGGGESVFTRTTMQNIGKAMAVVYVETQARQSLVEGKLVTSHEQVEKIISIATIQDALGNTFQITNLGDAKYAQDLALLLRSGALAAPVNIIQERTVGPSLGKANINKGVLSVTVGALAVIIFMAIYYRLFGLIADAALLLNIVFIVAILSLLGATLTLPGIAGIVLTVGMAVDANVLINERIREELRHGITPQASIRLGYERAFATIIDANVTTLIVAIILFALGSGVVKGFAVVLIIGLLTSMVTAIFFTRGIVNFLYGRKNVKTLSIGITVAPKG